MTSKPHSSQDFRTIRELAEYVGIEAPTVDIFMHGTTNLLMALGRIEEQLRTAREALAFYDPADDADAAIDFAQRALSNPASAPDVDGLPCRGTGAEYLVEQDNSNPASRSES